MRFDAFFLVLRNEERIITGLFCIFSLSSCFFFLVFFFSFFQHPSFCVFYNLLTLLRRWFTPISLIHVHLSLLLSSPFLSFTLSLSLSFFLLFSLSFLPSLLLFVSLSLPADFLVRRPLPCRTASDGPVIVLNPSLVFLTDHLSKIVKIGHRVMAHPPFVHIILCIPLSHV